MRLSLSSLAFACICCCSTLAALAQETASIALNETTAPNVSATTPVSKPAGSSATRTEATALVLKTRCLDTGLLRLGANCVFQVVEPMKLGEQTFAVGDLIYAHVETVQGVAGRVYMRTDRVICAKTQHTAPLSMVATEQPRQPGVGIPHMLDGWKLNWEQL